MIQHITKPFKYFFKLESSSGFVLLFAAILALIISNGSYSEDYFSILQKYIILGTKDFGLKLNGLNDDNLHTKVDIHLYFITVIITHRHKPSL